MIYEVKQSPNQAQIGGKAYHLARLSQAAYPVPPFFALTKDFFEAFLGEDLATYRSLLADYSPAALDDIRRLIEDKDFSRPLRQMVVAKLGDYFSPGDRLSVRSSAGDEDGEAHSFAGMMESFLNVGMDDSLFTAIKKCYLSCFSDRAMAYRQANGLINPQISMGVIIQQMIDAHISVVMFTTNPQSNNPDECLISAVYGLGENLVSGQENSYDAVVDRFGEILQVSADMPLTGNQLKDLAKLGERIEDLYPQKRGRDIELCLKDGQIYVLQARLITNYRRIDKNKFRTILDNSNIIESYCGPTTPLTFSFAREVYEKIYRQTLNNFYIDPQAIEDIGPDLAQMIYFYENKIYYRLNSWYKMTALYPGYNKNKVYMEKMMGVKIGLKESAGQAKFRLFKIYLRFIYKLLRLKRDSRHFVCKFEEVTRPYFHNSLENYDNEQLVDIYNQLETSILDDFTTPITNDMGAMVFLGFLSDRVKKSKIPDGEGLISKLLSKQGNVESVKQSLALMEIVNQIQDDPDLDREFKTKSIGDLIRQLEDGRPINQALKAYIHAYGPRAMDELKLETISLYEDPTFLFQTIKNYLNMDRRVEVYQADSVDENDFYRHFNLWQRLTLKPLVQITKFFVKNRELLRLRRTYIYSIVRSIFLRIGHNLAESGQLVSHRDIFFLTKPEIFDLIKDRTGLSPDLKAKIEKRKHDYLANQDKEIYERMYFYGQVKAEYMVPIFSRQESQAKDDSGLYGVAGGGGLVEGRVKLVTDPADANVDGYILMARRTDPGWTVLFPMAKAIIIERGSVLSHSAVIAREMGLTLVVGIRGLTDRVKDGMLVRVDGLKGRVEILEDEQESKE